MSTRRPPARTAPARPPGSPGRPKDPGKRQAILAAASRLFMEQGYAGASMDAIAAAAGVSKLTVYSHFGDKEGLFHAAVRATSDALVPDTLFTADSEAPLRQQLLDIGHAFFTLVSSEAALAAQRMILSPDTDESIRQLFWQAGPARITDALVSFLAPRVARGELAIEDLELAASQFFCLVKGELHHSLMCGMGGQCDAAQADRHVTSAVDFFIRGYARP